MARQTKTFTVDGATTMDPIVTSGIVYNKVTIYEDGRKASQDYRVASPLITSPKIIKLAGEKHDIEVPVNNGKNSPFSPLQTVGYVETGTYNSVTDTFTPGGSARFAQEED